MNKEIIKPDIKEKLKSDIKEKIKSDIKEKYDLAIKNILSKAVVFNISKKNVDESYSNTIKKIEEEFDNFNKNKSHYSIINNLELKDKKLLSETNKIANNFFNLINPLVDTKYISIIEEEMLLNNKIQNQNKIEEHANKNIMNRLNNNVSFLVTKNNTWW